MKAIFVSGTGPFTVAGVVAGLAAVVPPGRVCAEAETAKMAASTKAAAKIPIFFMTFLYCSLLTVKGGLRGSKNRES